MYVGLGLIAVSGAGAFYVLFSVYRGLRRLLKDPDTWKLLDGEESE